MKKYSDYLDMPLRDKARILGGNNQKYYTGEEVEASGFNYKFNAGALQYNFRDECYRDQLVNYLPMLPLFMEKQVKKEEADYHLYQHRTACIEDFTDIIIHQLKIIDSFRKPGSEIIVVGKACNVKPYLNGEIENISFIFEDYTKKLGERFGFDFEEEYVVWDDASEHLAIWPVDGCLKQNCGFCRRTFMDIPFKSVPLEYIKEKLDQIKATNPERLKRISLRAENLTEYGIDIYGKQALEKVFDLISSYEEVKEIDIPIGLCLGQINNRILDSMCRAPLRGAALNCESGSQRIVDLIEKGHTNERAIYIFNRLREAHPGMFINSNFIIGFPTERITEMYETANLISKLDLDYIDFKYYGCVEKHPLAKYPQNTLKQNEYHLSILLKLIASYPNKRPLTISYPAPLNLKKRRTIKHLEKLYRENKSYEKPYVNYCFTLEPKSEEEVKAGCLVKLKRRF